MLSRTDSSINVSIGSHLSADGEAVKHESKKGPNLTSAVRTKRMLDKKANQTPLDFGKIHHIRATRMRHGRNPKSFPKDSELWHFYRESSARADSVRKGRTVWEMLDEHDQKLSDGGVVFDSHYVKEKDFVIELTDRFKYVHGTKIDTGEKSKVHFGSLVVVMNYQVLLCVIM